MEKKIDKIRHCAVIRYLGLKSITPMQVHQNIMEATLGEDTPSYNMVKKWAGKFKCGRENLEDTPPPIQEDCIMPDFVHFFHFQGLKG